MPIPKQKSVALAATPSPSTEPAAPIALPVGLADVALIDAKVAAAVGGMSVSWWHAEVAAGRAPQPAVRRLRCTRWSASSVHAFWKRFAEQGADTEKTRSVIARAVNASAAAKAKRQALQAVA